MVIRAAGSRSGPGFGSGRPRLRNWVRRPASVGPLAYVIAALALVPGAAAAFLGVDLLDNLTPSTRVHAVVTDRTEVDAGPDDLPSARKEARADDGRAFELGTNVPGNPGDPVVVTLSTVTGRVVAIRTADDLHHPHRTNEYLFLIVFLVCPVAAAALSVRWAARIVPWTALLAVTLVGFLGVGVGRLASVPEIGSTAPVPTTGMGIYDDPEYFPDTRVGTGQPAEVDGVTLRVTGPVSRGAPGGSADWLRDFHVLVVPFSTAYEGGTYGETYRRIQLIGDGPGNANGVADRYCGPRGFDGHVPAGATEGRMCFVAPRDFRPRYVIVGTGADEVAVAVALG